MIPYKILKILFLFNFYRISDCNIGISGVQCGQKTCKIEEYCSDFGHGCQPCTEICTQNHHNFDESKCVNSCQDYLHNVRYIQKNASGASDGSLENLKDEVSRLSKMVTIALTLVCFMLLVLSAILGFQLYRWKIKKNITLKNLKSKLFMKSETAAETRGENQREASQNNRNDKPDLRLDISNISTISEHSPVTAITSISTRRPAEDSALDYAYDNHAMSTR